ncbi:DUF4012 domain-containing protein [Microbacter sp. GSS18]|nr:DUF4012 domain-containing protein [Microbacter sp. GSS18]
MASLLILALIALGWVAARGGIAADHLRSAREGAVEVVANIDDPTSVAASITAIAEDTGTARGLTSDPAWRIVEQLPWIGPQLRAISTIAASADNVTRDALTPLAEVASTLSTDAFRPVDGRISLDGFVAVQDAAAQAARSMGGAADAVELANSPGLVPPLAEVVDEVSDLFTETAHATDALARASVLVPAMLGQDGPRDYLVIFQNNAEWRSLGGIAGALAVVHTDDGDLTLTEQDYAASMGVFIPPVMDLGPELTSVYGVRPATWMHNVTQVPDFAVSGELARAMWAERHGIEVDGVIALDPVTLSYILEATGPVELPLGDTISADNAVELLLNEVYVRYPDPAEQNQFFSDTTSAIFTTLTQNGFDASGMLAGLARAGDEYRVMLWSAHDDDQAVLADTTLAGAPLETTRRISPFGVYLNDGTGSKMDYHQTVETTAMWDACTLDAAGAASGTAVVDVTIANEAPDSGLAEYITGGGAYGVEPGSASTVGYVYLPAGFELVDAALSTGDGFGGAFIDGRQVLSFEILLAPGESATAHIAVRTTQPSGAQLAVRQTPTVNAEVTPEVGPCLMRPLDSTQGSP